MAPNAKALVRTIFGTALVAGDVMCEHFNKIYISAYTIVICHFSISIVNNNENWLLVSN
jgi:hypothetical protein